MFIVIFLQLLNNAISIYTFVLLAYALLSWFPGAYNTPLGRWIEKLARPYLSLFYPLNLRIGMLDLTVAVAILALQLGGRLLLQLLASLLLW